MSESKEVLDFLRVRFARVDETLAKIVQRQDEHTTRLGRLERSVAHLDVRLGEMQVELAEHSVRMDRLNSSIERIERRLDLVEAP